MRMGIEICGSEIHLRPAPSQAFAPRGHVLDIPRALLRKRVASPRIPGYASDTEESLR